MKEERELNDADLEQLLRSKNWSQLSEVERKAAGTIVSGPQEYDRLYAMVHQLKTTAGVHDAEMIPSGEIRESLLLAFDEEQRRKRVLWWSVMGFWLRDKLRLDIPAMRLGLASVVLAAGIFTLWKATSGETAPTGIAETKKSPVIQPEQNRTAAQPKIENENLKVIGDSDLLIMPWSVPVPEQNNDEVVEVQNNPAPEPIVQTPQLVNQDSAGIVSIGGNDSLAVNLPTIDVAIGNADVVCCGATQLLTNGGSMYNWIPAGTMTNLTSPAMYTVTPTNANVASIQLIAPNCRSLANDQKVIDAFFSLK